MWAHTLSMELSDTTFNTCTGNPGTLYLPEHLEPVLLASASDGLFPVAHHPGRDYHFSRERITGSKPAHGRNSHHTSSNPFTLNFRSTPSGSWLNGWHSQVTKSPEDFLYALCKAIVQAMPAGNSACICTGSLWRNNHTTIQWPYPTDLLVWSKRHQWNRAPIAYHQVQPEPEKISYYW